MAVAYPSGPPASAQQPCSRVELHISCDDLRDADLFSKSDPIVSVHTQVQKRWVEYARTEWIQNTLSPRFSKVIEMDYRFEEMQKLKFAVYDIDNVSDTLADDDFLGQIECNLGEVVSASSYTKPLEAGAGKKKSKGTITIRAEELSQNQSLMNLKFSAAGLDNKDFFGKSDPYLEFEKENSDGTFSTVHRTDVLKNTLNPSWKAFDITSQRLCSSDSQKKIKVTCFDWDSDGSHDLIGTFTTSLGEMEEASRLKKNLVWDCINPEKQRKKKKYHNSGTVKLDHAMITKTYSFLEYVMGGCQINFTVGIDFTASNGEPNQPDSLHYLDPHKPNQYTSALIAVGDICQDYDSDKLFPALGFGGKVGDTISHEFALNGNPENPYCAGVAGVVQAYHTALRSVRLYGPTNFSPIINHVARFAKHAADNPQEQQYFILLMLTDGAISDMVATKRAIIAASTLPMSIIIVGVGGANFDAMDELDCDEGRLTVGYDVAERDIVQFVPFRKYEKAAPGALASAVLAEIPRQLTDYMTKRKMKPQNLTGH